MIRFIALAVALLLPTACGLGNKGKDDDVPSEAEVLGIVSLSVSPGSASLCTLGTSVDLACTAHLADGSAKAQSALWSADAGIVSLNLAEGATVTAVATGTGSVTITAAFAGLSATAQLLTGAAAITDPGTVYGGNSNGGGFYQYPASPDADPVQLAPLDTYQGDGLMIHPSGASLYAIAYDATNPTGIASIFQCTIATGEVVLFANLPGSHGYRCLDDDPEGNLYTLEWSTGKVLKITPAGLVSLHCTSGHTGVFSMDGMAIGWDPAQDRSDVPYYFSSNGITPKWIHRQEFSAGVAVMFAGHPSTWWPTCGGMAIDEGGVIYATCLTSNQVYRYKDENADGDASDPGEEQLFATLPFSLGNLDWEYVSPAIARGGSILIHVGTFGSLGPVDAGVYWLVDRDPAQSGGLGMVEEVVKFHPQWMEGSNSGSFQYLVSIR